MEKDNNDTDPSLKPSYTNHDGYLMPKGFPVEGFVSGLKYHAQPDDLFVATYPKCGTTWMQNIVYLLLNDGEPIKAKEKLDQIFPHLEEVGADCCGDRTTVNGYRLIKTHLPYNMTPQHAKAKYICIVRNPKDCVVSFFHHTRGFEKFYNFANGSFDTYFDLFLKGEVDFNDYFDHLRSWLDHRHDENVLFLKYEDMRANTREAVCQVSRFLQGTVENEASLLDRVLEHSSLSSMKKDPLRWSTARPANHTPFIRSGSVGEWDELLRPEQAELLNKRMRETRTDEELQFLGDKYQ